MDGGWMGKVLKVDLTNRTVDVEPLDFTEARDYVGGAGLGVKWLYDMMPQGIEAFDEESPLIFTTGPLTGTDALSSGAYCVVTLSPLTGYTIAMGSANGFFGVRLKSAGYDAIIIKGKADSPVYLLVNEDTVEIRDASELWGLTTLQTEEKLKEIVDHKNAGIACIGPAGENLVKYALIASDFGHVASSGGIGAVMGSKMLKGIVAWGSNKTPIVNPEATRENCKEWKERVRKSSSFEFKKKYGTVGSVMVLHSMGDLPVKNLTTNLFPEGENITGMAIKEQFETKVKPCYKCPINHCKYVKLNNHEGVTVEEPEYEGSAALGSNIGVSNTEDMLYLHFLVDEYGMDIKTITFVISLCMEAYEKGLLTKEQLDGIDLTWGNAEAVEMLLEKITKREGIGDILAENLITIADYIGEDAHDMAVHIRGAGIHLHDIRSLWGFGLSHVISNFASTMEGIVADLGPEPEFGYTERLDPLSPDGHAKAQAAQSKKDLLCDCLIVCTYNVGRAQVRTDVVFDTLNSVTGADYSMDEVWTAMERVTHLARSFNVGHGLTPDHDWPSDRLLQTPIDGPIEGKTWRPHLKGMVQEYYEVMGWDVETGKPLRSTLEKYNLGHVADDLWGSN